MTDMPGNRLSHPVSDALLDGALAFLDLAYETAESPSRLREALALLAELIGAPSVLLLSSEGSERRLVAAAHAASRPANDGASIHLRSDRVRTIPLSGALELVVDPGAIQPLQETLLLRLAPHLARALRFADRHAHDEEGEQQNVARLDRLAIAVALLDPDGQIVVLNRAARLLLGASTALELAGHRFQIRHGVTRVLFESLVERVTAPPDPDRQFVGGRLMLADGQWGRVDLLVAPYWHESPTARCERPSSSRRAEPRRCPRSGCATIAGSPRRRRGWRSTSSPVAAATRIPTGRRPKRSSSRSTGSSARLGRAICSDSCFARRG
jgi:PAS domain-containing protein